MPTGTRDFFSSSKRSDWLWGPFRHLFNEWRSYIPAVKRPVRAVDHLPVSGAEVKNEWSCTIIPPVCLRGMDRDYFTFTLHNTVNLSLSEPCLELLTERLL